MAWRTLLSFLLFCFRLKFGHDWQKCYSDVFTWSGSGFSSICRITLIDIFPCFYYWLHSMKGHFSSAVEIDPKLEMTHISKYRGLFVVSQRLLCLCMTSIHCCNFNETDIHFVWPGQHIIHSCSLQCNHMVINLQPEYFSHALKYVKCESSKVQLRFNAALQTTFAIWSMAWFSWKMIFDWN